MAIRSTLTAGDLSSATAFGTVRNTPDMHATTNITNNTTGRFTATFTAPNTTDAVYGVWLWVTALSTSVNWVITLQESTVDTAATVTVAAATLIAGWNYFEFPAPYTYTTTVAGAYRIKHQLDAGSSTIAANAAGTTAAYLVVDSVTGAIGATDDIWIHKACTVTGTTFTHGSRAEVTLGGLATTRSVGAAMVIGPGGSLTFPRGATSKITTKGYVFVESGGVYDRGTDASPIPAGVTATHTFSPASTNVHGFVIAATGTCDIVGTRPLTADGFYRSRVISGDGSTATPLTVTDAVDWAVGDEICLETVSGLTETEYKFVRTKVSPTQYTLAATAGGAESALTNTHVGGWALHLTRNVITNTDNTARGFNFSAMTLGTGSTGFRTKWARYDNLGSTSSQGAFRLVNAGTTSVTDYCVLTGFVRRGWLFTSTKSFQTYTGNIICRALGNAASATSTGMFAFSASNNKTFIGCHALDSNMTAVETITSFNIRFEDCHFTGNNRTSIALLAGMNLTTSGLIVFDGCSLNATGRAGVSLIGATDVTFSNCELGIRGDNTIEVENTTDTYNTVLFDRCDIGSTTRVSNNTLALPGTLIRFHAMNGNDNDHTWYTVNGQGRSTGAGLVDTTIKTVDSLGVRLAPETEDGINQRFSILAKPDNAVSVLGFVKLNAAFTGDADTVCTANLTLPGEVESADSQVMSKLTNDWQVFNLAALYSGTVTAFATITINATNINLVSAAYAYIDDMYNGTNEITALDVWLEGQPSSILFEQLGDAAAVWAVSTSTLTTTGTIGNHVAKKISTKVTPSY